MWAFAWSGRCDIGPGSFMQLRSSMMGLAALLAAGIKKSFMNEKYSNLQMDVTQGENY